MIRQQALDQAIQCALECDDSAGMAAFARLGELWLGIADRLPEREPDPEPVLPAPEGDEASVSAACGHRVMAALIRGAWYHPATMAECDDPPIGRAKRR